jgi:hypothetical protein
VTVTGNGTVKSVDTAINCTSTGGATCTSTYNFGTAVTLNATNNVGSHFTTWSDPACGTTNPCTLTMSAAKSITATFALNAHTVTISLTGTGGGTVASAETPTPKLSCTESTGSLLRGTCTAQYNFGDQFTVTASPDSVSSQGAANITGAPSTCVGPSCTVTVGDNDIQASVTFTHNPILITVSFAGSGTGTVTDGTSSCTNASTPPCTLSETYGSNVTLTATPDSTAVFTSWSGACTPAGNVCTINGITADPAPTVTFTKAFSVAVAAGGNGSGTVTSDVGGMNCTVTKGVANGICSVAVLFGASITLSASLPTGTASVSWSGGCISSTSSCSLTNITSQPAATTASFVLQTFTVAVSGGGNGSGTITGGSLSCIITSGAVTSGTCSTTVNYGSNLTMSFAPATSTQANANWAGGCTSPGTTSCTLTNITGTPLSTTATLALKTFTVAVTGGGNGSGTITGGSLSCAITSGAVTGGTCSTTVNYGSNLTMSFAPATSTQANANWTGGCASTGTTSCTFSNITGTPLSTTATLALKTFVLTVTPAGNGQGNVTSSPGTINCGNLGATCTNTFNYGDNVTLSMTRAAGSMFIGWSGACGGTASTCGLNNIVVDLSVGANFVASFCPATVPAGQSFSAVMQGCPGTVGFANRVCAPGSHVCTAQEWVQNRGGNAPTHHYWTDDVLNRSNAAGACGPTGCGAANSNCFATSGLTYAGSCGASTPTRVCAGNGGTTGDPEGNSCDWTGCGFNSASQNDFFGGCSANANAGTLCCNGPQHWFVGPNGADNAPPTNGTTSSTPFKTLTFATQGAWLHSGDTIFASAGTYSAGETFPLNVKAGVALIGDEPSRGANTIISGSLTPGSGSTIAGFIINPGPSAFAITSSSSGAVIRNNTITNSQIGIFVNGGSGTVILLNSLTNNNHGLAYVSPSAPGGGKIENNTVTGNTNNGIEYDVPGGDLGGGAANSVGNNIVSCNTLSDVYALGAPGMSATNNRWDHTPPSNSNSNSGGIDTVGSVVTTGATLAPNPCPNPCTGAASIQLFDGYMAGCGASSALAFGSRASLCSSGCHACTAQEWVTHRAGLAPNLNLWTGDNTLFYVSGGSNNCIVSATSGSSCSPGAMLICPSSGTYCNVFGCGLDNNTPNFFGGCSVSSGAGNFGFAGGTACCCP